jgi:sterol desaturase/sphingolipid hydroxylase (fatty acid hydroxylase superfamily)
LNLCSGTIVCACYLLTAPATNTISHAVVRSLGAGFVDLRHLPTSTIPDQIICAVVYLSCYDLFYYVWHRAQHKIPALWSIHAVHHSDTGFDATTFLRQNWLESLLQSILLNIPLMAVFDLPDVSIFGASVLVMSWGFIMHLDVPLQLGSWSWVIAGPQLHRLHHSALPEHSDTNFASFLPLLDMALGSYRAPAKDEFPPTGLSYDTDPESKNLLWVVTSPFRIWADAIIAVFRSLSACRGRQSDLPNNLYGRTACSRKTGRVFKKRNLV